MDMNWLWRSGYRLRDGLVFLYGEELKAADGATFEVLATHLARDAKTAWYRDYAIKGADAASFRVLGGEYAADGQRVYFQRNALRVDATTFRPVGGCYAVDSSHVYVDGQPLPGADPLTFEVLDPGNARARDARAVYAYKTTREGLSPRDFAAWEGGYERHGDSLFCLDKLLEGVDAASFRVLGRGYAADAQRVFHHGTHVPGADASNFRVLPEVGVGHDGRAFFRGAIRLEEEGTGPARPLGWELKRIGDGIYGPLTDRLGGGTSHGPYEVAGIDVETFEVLSEFFSKDRHRAYHFDGDRLTPLDGVEVPTFGVWSSLSAYARDARRVYVDGSISLKAAHRGRVLVLEGANPARAELLPGGTLRDGKKLWHRCVRAKTAASGGSREVDPLAKRLDAAFVALVKENASFSDAVVAEVTADEVRLGYPLYDGVDASPWLLAVDDLSLQALQRAAGRRPMSLGHWVRFVSDATVQDKVQELKRVAKERGYPHFGAVRQSPRSALLWFGFDKAARDERAAGFWAQHEQRMLAYCRRFVSAWAGPLADALNPSRAKSLRKLSFFGDESISLAVNVTSRTMDPVWWSTPLASPPLLKKATTRDIALLLYRVALKLEAEGNYAVDVSGLHAIDEGDRAALLKLAGAQLRGPVDRYMDQGTGRTAHPRRDRRIRRSAD